MSEHSNVRHTITRESAGGLLADLMWQSSQIEQPLVAQCSTQMYFFHRAHYPPNQSQSARHASPVRQTQALCKYVNTIGPGDWMQHACLMVVDSQDVSTGLRSGPLENMGMLCHAVVSDQSMLRPSISSLHRI